MAKSSLEDFFDELYSTQRANRALFRQWYAIIDQIDDCFVRAGIDLLNPKPFVAGILLDRCNYAFKTAAGMALAGQVVEVHLVLRALLEYAGYSLLICETPVLQSVFLDRHGSESEMRTSRKAFTIGNVREAVARYDLQLATLYDDLYQRTIDFGAHPNPHATFASAELRKHDGNAFVKTFAISDDPLMLEFALKSTAQAGLASLYVLEHVFKGKFELLGIDRDMRALSRNGLL
jgi:hypothetical protein